MGFRAPDNTVLSQRRIRGPKGQRKTKVQLTLLRDLWGFLSCRALGTWKTLQPWRSGTATPKGDRWPERPVGGRAGEEDGGPAPCRFPKLDST